MPLPHAARLNELLDVVKREFEALSADASGWKDQRDEMEAKSASRACVAVSAQLADVSSACLAQLSSVCSPLLALSPLLPAVSQQIHETALLRQGLYELEAQHLKIRQE